MNNITSFHTKEAVYKLAIANIPEEKIIESFTNAGFAGSVWSGKGFGAWGIEPTTFVEIATIDGDKVKNVAEKLMNEYGESAIYVTINGRSPVLWWNDGKITTCSLETVENILNK